MRERISNSSPDCPGALMGRLSVMWVHPDPVRRLGAGLAFNHCYRIFREEEPLVDRFTLELAVCALRSLSFSGGEESDFGASAEAEKSLAHLLRIIKQKSKLLETESDFRRVPGEVGGKTLSDFVSWLFGHVTHSSEGLRHKAIELIHELTDAKSMKEAFKKHLKSKGQVEKEFVKNVVESKELLSSAKVIEEASEEELTAWLERMVAVLECATWISATKLVGGEEILAGKTTAMKSLSGFVGGVDILLKKVRDLGHQGMKLQDLVCRAIVRTLDFVCQSSPAVAKQVWDGAFWDLLGLLAHSPSRVGFDTQQGKEAARALEDKVNEVVQFYTYKAFGSVPKPSFQDFGLGEAIGQVLEGRADRECAQNLRGFLVLRPLAKFTKAEEKMLEGAPIQLYEGKLSEGSLQRERPALAALLDLAVKSSANRTESLGKMARAYLQSPPSSKALEEEFVGQLMEEPKVFLEAARERAEEEESDCGRAIHCVVKFLQAAIVSGKQASLSSHVSVLRSLWKMAEKSSSSLEGLDSAIMLSRALALACPEFLPETLPWFASALGRKDVGLGRKIKVLDLLSPLLSSEKELDKLEKALDSLSDTSFPLSSSDLDKNSAAAKDYGEVLGKLFVTLRETCSPEVLSFLAVLVCREKNHTHSDKMQDCLSGLLKKFPAQAQAGVAQRIFELFSSDARCSDEMRLKVLDKVLVPLLAGASSVALRRFFIKNVEAVLEGLLVALQGSEEKRTADLVKRIGSCKLVGAMYGRLGKDLLHTGGSEVSRQAYQMLKRSGQTKSPSFTGKEMGQFLVSKLMSFRAEIIDGSAKLRELFRQFQCSAYNATMSVITCLQSDEKFYNNYLFAEQTSKSQMIWSRIVDKDKVYEFPLEVDEAFSAKRKQIVTLRKSAQARARESAAEDLGFSSLSSHYLGDSSLSQDVTMFDFSMSVVNLSQALSGRESNGGPLENGAEKGGDDDGGGNAVFLDNEDLNNHECMGSLLALIDYMRDSKIYPVPEEEGKDEPKSLPAWMAALMEKLREGESKNVSFFILKVIVNRPDVFAPFAKLLGFDLLRLAVSEDVWGASDVNTLRLDLVTLLLAWSDRYVPGKDLLERNLATTLVEQLVKSALGQSNREVLKYLVELVRAASTAWGECLTSGGAPAARELHQAMMRRGEKAASVAVQIVGVMLQVFHLS